MWAPMLRLWTITGLESSLGVVWLAQYPIIIRSQKCIYDAVDNMEHNVPTRRIHIDSAGRRLVGGIGSEFDSFLYNLCYI
jgi:hypothetical protein